MAKASQVAWVGFALGVALAGGANVTAAPWSLAGVPGLMGQTSSGPASASAALNEGRENYRRGDFETAGILFQQAQGSLQSLTPTQQNELNRWVQLNNQALQARREGAVQLRQAEEAVKTGQGQLAGGLFRTLSTNQYLSPADRVRVQQLAEKLGNGPAPRGVSETVVVDPAIAARTKLNEARQLMAQADYDGAQAAAGEASQMSVTFTAGEDSPRRVQEDISRARGDAKGLLASARLALQRGQYDLAEHLANQASKASSAWTFRPWGDNPTKVMKEVQAARKLSPVMVARDPGQPTGITLEARKVFTPETTVPAPLPTPSTDWKSSPDMIPGQTRPTVPTKETVVTGGLQVGVNGPTGGVQVGVNGPNGQASVRVDVPNPVVTLAPGEDPRTWLTQGRQLLEQGRLEDAEKVAQAVRGTKPSGWTLFEDSPDRLLADIHKSRHKQDQARSAQLLVEARQLLQQGDLEAAKLKVQQAETLHGPYGVWEGGDRPHMILTEIELAERKQNRTEHPPAPNSPANAQTMLPPTANATLPPSSPGNPAQGRALALMVEARQLQSEGRLTEARQKALDAQRNWSGSGSDESRPDLFLVQLASLASRQIDTLQREAGAQLEAGRYKLSEEKLLQARELALGFGMDCQPIANKLAWVHQATNIPVTPAGPLPSGVLPPASAATAPVLSPAALAQGPTASLPPAPGSAPPAPAANGPLARGRELLEQARLELRNGELDNARRLAGEAFKGPYGIQGEAEAMLRSIDAEEYNQRSLVTNRNFAAGLNLYYHQDYAQAMNIFQSLDGTMLTPPNQSKLRELMLMPELQPRALVQAGAKVPTVTGTEEPGQGRASDLKSIPFGSPEQSYAKQVLALQNVKFQEMKAKGQEAQVQATRRATTGDLEQALEVLQQYLADLQAVELEPEQMAMLKGPIDRRLQYLKTIKANQELAQMASADRSKYTEGKLRDIKAEEHKEQQIADLMKQYNQLYAEGKYKEAEVKALQAHDLDPDNTAASAGIHLAQMAGAHANWDHLKKEKEDFFLGGMNETDKEGPALTVSNPITGDPDPVHQAVLKHRAGLKPIDLTPPKSEKEREIERRLLVPTNMNFTDASLKQVLDDLGAANSINIVPDVAALNDKGISLDQPLSLKLEAVSLKSALNLLLSQAHLTYVIKDEVLLVTTEDHARGKMIQKVYQVADIVIPVDNHTDNDSPLVRALEQSTGQSTLTGGAGAPTNRASLTTGGLGGLANGPTGHTTTSSLVTRMPGQTLQDLLMELITGTIKPDSWSKEGGQGTIDYFPLGAALVVTQTPDIQEQIQDLLTALRRLQDLEVAVEIRFITLDEAFYERIGLDFNVNILNNKSNNHLLSQLGSGVPLSRVAGTSTVGLTPAGSFTSDLNIPIHSTSFPFSAPPFGGFPNSPNIDGGLSLGLAFLSDIQVFMFMEAAQADRRTNVMQAPKLTLFNGQTSSLNVNTSQFFVTNVSVTPFGGQLVFQPTNTQVQTGVSLTIQAVVSADRRYVRLSLTPQLSNVATPVTALFPVTAFITPILEGGVQGQPVPFTQFIQQPVTTSVSVETTVSVPDGGTVLMGGLKTLREGRNEAGPPILSKIPYINRLFKNVGYGREAESLMIMVTPRIIINEEEENIAFPIEQAPVPGG